MSSSKSNMRVRALDPDKPMAIIDSVAEPEILDPAYAINRAVLQMPTGMEKEEETVLTARTSTVTYVVQCRSGTSRRRWRSRPRPRPWPASCSFPRPRPARWHQTSRLAPFNHFVPFVMGLMQELYPHDFKMPRDYIRFQRLPTRSPSAELMPHSQDPRHRRGDPTL